MSSSAKISMEEGDIDDVKLSLDEKFSQLQESQGENMKVFVRIRPLSKEEEENGYTECISFTDEKTVETTVPADSVKYKNMFYKPVERFTFSQAFGPDENQFHIFENTMSDIIQTFVDGSNSLVFAYGSSGSGKTYTMQGTNSDPGIIPLAVQLVFELIKDKMTESPIVKPNRLYDIIKLTPSDIKKELHIRDELLQIMDNETGDSCRSDKLGCLSISNIFNDMLDSFQQESSSNLQRIKNLGQESMKLQNNAHCSIWVSFIEIYNEKIYDLLQPMGKRRKHYNLGEDKQGNIYVKGAQEVFVNSCDEIFKLLRVGRRNLKIASTKLNYQSSRSHCIFNIKVIRVTNLESSSSARVNVLSFCDLAGSERSCKTKNTGLRLKEAGNINTSLLVLGRCVEALRQNQFLKEKKIVPFRDSKLTYLFSGFFSGKGKASMIINVSPSSYTFDESLTTLKFSALAKEVTMLDDQWSTKLRRLSQDYSKTFQVCKGRGSDASETSFEDNGFLSELMAIDEEKEEAIKELLDHARMLESQVTTLQDENKYLEDNLKAELSRYYENMYGSRIASMKESYEKLRNFCHEQSNKRIQALLDDIAKSQQESGSESDTDGEEDHKENSSNSHSIQHPKEDEAGSSMIAKLQTLNDEKEERIADLESQLEDSEKAQDIETKKWQLKINEYDDLLKFKEQASKEQEKLSQEALATKDEKIDELVKEIETVCNASLLQEKEMQADKASLSDSIKQLAIKDKEISSLTDTVETLKASMAKMQEQLLQNEDTIAKTTSEMSKKCTEVETFMQEIGTLEKEYNRMEEKLSQKEAAIEKITTEMSQKASELEKLVQEMHTLKKNSETLEEQCKTKDLTLEENGLQINMKDIELTKLKREVSEFERKLAVSDKSLEDVQKDYLSMSTDYNKAIENIKELEVELQQKESKQGDGLANVKFEVLSEIPGDAILDKADVSITAAESEEVVKQNAINSILFMSHDQLKEVLEVEPLLKSKVSDLLGLPAILEQLSVSMELSSKLEADIEALNETISEKTADIDKLNLDIRTLTEGYTLDIEKLTSVEEELKSKGSLLNIKETESLKYLEETKVLKKSIEDLVAAEIKLKKEIDELKKGANSKSQQADVLKKEFSVREAELKEEINQFKKNLESKQQLVDSKEKDFKKVSEGLTEKINKMRKELEQKEAALESQNNDSKKVTEYMNEEVNELKKIVASKETVIESMSKEHSVLVKEKQEKITELTNDLKGKDQLVKSQENSLNKVIDDLKGKVKQLEKVIAAKNEEINSAVEESKKSSSHLNEEIDKLKKEFAEKKELLDSQNKDHNQIVSDLEQQLKNQKETLKSKDRLIHEQCEDSKKIVDTLTQEIKDLKQKSISSEDQGLNSTIEKHLKNISELEQTIASKDSIINEQIEDSKRMTDDLNDKIAQLMQDLNAKELVVQTHEKDLKEMAEINEKNIADLKKDLASKETRDKGSQKLTDSLNKRIEKLDKTVSLKDITISTQKDEMKAMADDFEKELVKLRESKEAETNDKIQKLETELSLLKKNLESKNALIKSLEASRSSTRAEDADATVTLSSDSQESEEENSAENIPAEEQPVPAVSVVKTKVAPSRVGRGRPRALPVSSIPSPIRKPKVETVSSIPSPIKRGRVEMASSISSPIKRGRVQKAENPVKPVLEKEKPMTPGNPIKKKLRSRTAEVNYKMTDDSPNVPKKKKMSPPEEATEGEKPQGRFSRQKVSRPLRGASASASTSKASPTPMVDQPSAAEKTVKTKATALSYLSPKKTPPAKSYLATRRKRNLHENIAQAAVAEAATIESAKSPPGIKKAAKEVTRQIAKRKLRP